MAQDISLDPDFLWTELKKSCRAMSFIHDNTLELIQDIRNKGIKVVLATDNMDVFESYTVPALDLQKYFDDILSSSTLRCLKADLDEADQLIFFQSWLSQQGLSIEEAVLIDDSVKNKNFFEGKGLCFLPVNPDYCVIDHLTGYAY